MSEKPTIIEILAKKKARKARKKQHIAFLGLKRARMPSVKTLVHRLDILASEAVKRRDGQIYKGFCPLCLPVRGKQPEMATSAFHWVSRRHYKVRWDLINLTWTDWACNAQFSGKWGGGNQAPYWRWYISTHGQEQFDALCELSRGPAGLTRADLMSKVEEFTLNSKL